MERPVQNIVIVPAEFVLVEPVQLQAAPTMSRTVARSISTVADRAVLVEKGRLVNQVLTASVAFVLAEPVQLQAAPTMSRTETNLISTVEDHVLHAHLGRRAEMAAIVLAAILA